MDITINNKQYPILLTMGSIRRFKKITGKEITEIAGVDDSLTYGYCIVASSCASMGVEFELTLDEFADQLSPENFAILSQAVEDLEKGNEPKKKVKG